jgi:aryl-phospho-beta-D-glucosidase BglC (GH1 family)
MQRDGNLNAIEDHYKTFITEEDFAAIAAAGLNWVRIPLPFYAIEKWDGEPYLDRVAWTYFLKAIQWARKYGLRINVDLHSAPGSQNGWNHSGKLASQGFLAGTMGIANAQRTLNYIRIITEFISQPEYKNIVPFFGILNEPYSGANGGFIPDAAIKSFYAEAYRMIRDITGIGEGNGPVISINNAFIDPSSWSTFLPGADRLALDFHPYLVFGDQLTGTPDSIASQPCSQWSELFATSTSTLGITGAGEWSFAINDCGLYVNDVLKGARYEGNFSRPGDYPRIGSCAQWNDYTAWPAGTQQSLYNLGLAHMDALKDWFFWTWKIGPSLSGVVEAPFWSYKLALEQGWAPTDPRVGQGQCGTLGAPENTFSGALQPWQTGGAGAGDTPNLNQYVWPPTTIGGIPAASVNKLPQYTQTGSILSLPVPTFTQPDSSSTTVIGNGWANTADALPLYTPIAGCGYPDTWNAGTAMVAACIAARSDDNIPLATPTPPPR